MRLRAAAFVPALLAAIVSGPAVSEPTKAECEAATASVPAGADIEGMNAEQRRQAAISLKANLAVLRECLRGEIGKMGQAVADAKDECIRRGEPKIGMTPAELITTCWRKPLRILKKTTAAGVEEQYIYGGGNLIRVIQGRVLEIVEAR